MATLKGRGKNERPTRKVAEARVAYAVGSEDTPPREVVTGVTGVTVNLQLARVAELRLGSVILRDVPIAFAEVPPFAVFGLSDHPALLLGTDLLATFRRVSLDFRARKVRFQLRRCESTGIAIAYLHATH